MNRTDLIQNIMATEHQAQALTESAKSQKESMETTIDAEIEALKAKYARDAEEYLARLTEEEHQKSAAYLTALDQKLEAKLRQVDSIYASEKDRWVQAIFERIVGKAGG